jgi:hypothetical protein
MERVVFLLYVCKGVKALIPLKAEDPSCGAITICVTRSRFEITTDDTAFRASRERNNL